jgi:hypothetical protein
VAKLSPAELETYRDQGVLVPGFRLPEARLESLRAALVEVIAANPEVRPEQLVSVHIEGLNPEGVRGSRVFLDLARDADLLDLVCALIGPDVVLWGCQVFCKPAGDGMAVPWHQDAHYWPIRPLATCTLWLALDHSLPENGCLRVIPGSHAGRALYKHAKQASGEVTLTKGIEADAFDEAAARDVVLEPGQMSLHDVYLIHGSERNRSAKRRAGVAIRYMPAASHFDRGLIPPGDESGYRVDFSTRPLWLVRGIDRANNDFTIGHRPGRA